MLWIFSLGPRVGLGTLRARVHRARWRSHRCARYLFGVPIA